MKSSKKALTIIYIICGILAITAILSLSLSTNGKNIIKRETALLNPKYAPLITSIQLDFENSHDVLDLFLSDGGYIGNYYDMYFAINNAKITELIRLATTTIQAELISESRQTHQDYYVLENTNEAKIIRFVGLENETPTIFSALYFGDVDYTKTQRYVRSASNNDVYLIPDHYYTFLQTSPAAWVDPKIIPSIIRNNNPNTAVVSMVLERGNERTHLLSGDANFEERVHTILTLQSTNIMRAENYSERKGDYVLSVEYADNHIAFCSIYIENESVIIVPYSPQLLYALNISQWSFERILSAFTD